MVYKRKYSEADALHDRAIYERMEKAKIEIGHVWFTSHKWNPDKHKWLIEVARRDLRKIIVWEEDDTIIPWHIYKRWYRTDAEVVSEAICKIVNNMIVTYYREDYGYVLSLVRSGQTPVGISTVEEEVDFIKRNNLDMGLSDEDLRRASEIILSKIAEIEKDMRTKDNNEGQSKK
jgi:hypothetical protein